MKTDLNSSPWRGNRFHIFYGWHPTFSGSRFQWTSIQVLVIPSKNNFHSYVEQTKKLPKELCCWIAKQEFHLQQKHLQLDASLSIHEIFIRHFGKRKKKCPVFPNMVLCNHQLCGYCWMLIGNRVAPFWLPPVNGYATCNVWHPTHSLRDHTTAQCWACFPHCSGTLAGQFAATSSNNCPCISSFSSFCVLSE